MKRFTEPSTWAGLAALFQMTRAFVPPQYQIFVDGATTVAGALAGFIAEKGARAEAAAK